MSNNKATLCSRTNKYKKILFLIKRKKKNQKKKEENKSAPPPKDILNRICVAFILWTHLVDSRLQHAAEHWKLFKIPSFPG